MFTKIGLLLTSVRFWIIVLTAVLGVLNGAPVVSTIQMALAAVVTLGTLDSVATRIGGSA